MELYCPRLPKMIYWTQGVAGTVAFISFLLGFFGGSLAAFLVSQICLLLAGLFAVDRRYVVCMLFDMAAMVLLFVRYVQVFCTL